VHAAVASTLVFSIQLAVWKVVYGQWFIVPQGGGFLFGDRALALGQVLFSRWSGLISFHPWIALALVGLVIWARRAPALAGGAFLALAATWIINAGVKDWWAGVAFGARRWDAAFPLFALGAAAMLSLLPAGAARRVIGGGLCIALIGFNAVLGLLWSRAVLQEHWLELRPVARDLAATMLGHPGAWIESSMWKMFQARPENLAAALALTALVIAGLAAVAFISRGGRAPWPRGRRAMWTTCAVTLYVLLALAAVVWKGARPAPHRAEHLALREILLATEDDQERWGALQPLATAPDASCPALIAIGARTALRARNQTAGNQAAARDLLLDLEATAPHFAWYQTLLSVDDAEARDRALRALLENPRWGDAQFQRLVRREVVRQPDRALVSKLVAIPTADQSEILYARVEWARHEQQLIVEEELLPRVLHRLPHDVYSLRRLVELTEHRGDEETAAKWRENGGRWADAQLQTLERFARVDRPHVVAVRRPQVGHLAQSMIAMLDPDTQADRSWRTVERVRALLDPGDSMVVDLLHERLYRQWEGAREAPPGPRRARLLARIEAFADEWPWDVSGQTALIHTLSMHGRWADACAVLTEAESRFGEGPVIRELADWLVRDFPLEARGAIDCTLVPVSVRAQVADEIAARFSE
jgi:hypothetical protein